MWDSFGGVACSILAVGIASCKRKPREVSTRRRRNGILAKRNGAHPRRPESGFAGFAGGIRFQVVDETSTKKQEVRNRICLWREQLIILSTSWPAGTTLNR